MSRASVTVVIATALLIPLIAVAQPAEKPTRELVKNHEPILNRISPGDRFLLIKSAEIKEPPVAFSSAAIELRVLSQFDELFLLQQASLEPYLADNGTWIRTRVKGRVSQVLNTRRLALYPGATIEFEIDGGEMNAKGVRVVAGSPREITARPHLVALQWDAASKSWQLARGFELSDRETLEPMRRRDKSEPVKSKLHGKTLDEVAVAVAKGRQK